jgi:EAL and modified HD-GYP domain-containing signal transduction protein
MAELTSEKPRFIARQTILDKTKEPYGYELLFRSGNENVFCGESEAATNHIIDSCLSMIACSSSNNLFINCTRDALVNMSVTLLPSHLVVLEIMETVTPDAELIRACKKLKKLGFRLALDDFIPHGSNRALVDMADFIKVDFRASSPSVRQKIYDMCNNKATAFLAEKVETVEEVRTAQAEGNTFFQGYFYSRPKIIAEAQISTNRLTYLQMFAAVAKPSPDILEIERLLKLEPSLCYRLLRLANSALYGFRYRISSIHDALVTVGDDAFRKIVTVVLASKLSHMGPDRVVRQALERASFCESMAPLLNQDPAELYMLGMLSMMDRMLNIPMVQLLGLVCIDSRLENALLGSPNGIGRALELCKYHERGCNGDGLLQTDTLGDGSALNYFEALLSAGRILPTLCGMSRA